MSKVVTIPVSPGHRILIPGDIHFGCNDVRSLEVMTTLALKVGVNGTFLQGDTYDYHGLSKYPKSAEKAGIESRVIDEVTASRQWLAAWKTLGPLWMGPGNHEERWYGLVDANPALHGTHWFSPLEWYGLDDGVHFFGREYLAKMGPLLVCHGHQLRGAMLKHSAASVLGEYPGQNTLYGHTHRIDSCTRPTWKNGEPVSHGAWNVGHLQDVDGQDYAKLPVWEQGFAVIDFWKQGDGLGFTVYQARIHVDGKSRVCNLLGHTARI